MRRLLFMLTLALYGYSAMDLHEWAHVPATIAHLLEHHSDFGHHDEEGSGQGHEHPGSHNPFGGDCHETFCACSGAAFVVMHQTMGIAYQEAAIALGELPVEMNIISGSGSVWNPPKRA